MAPCRFLTVPSATHDCSLLLDTIVACAAACRSATSSMHAAASASCAHHVDDWRESRPRMSISQIQLCILGAGSSQHLQGAGSRLHCCGVHGVYKAARRDASPCWQWVMGCCCIP